MTAVFPFSARRRLSGFTLIELLVVIAIIGILAAIIIPTVGSVRTSANKAKTKTQFSQWASAMELFKQEYGYYPAIASSGTSSGLIDSSLFLGELTARKASGTKLTSTELGQQNNKKGISFYSASDSELLMDGSTPYLVDGFGNAQIVVMTDRDRDGLISGGELKSTAVTGGNKVDGENTKSVSPTIPKVGGADAIRAGVAFYSAGKGEGDSDVVTSW